VEKSENIERAIEYLQKAYKQQMSGNLEEAIKNYEASIELHPTAEAHTFLGWTYSFMGLYQQAIDECKKAIDIDPDFGNPYNDIGAYLIEMERLEEAIAWLERAKTARRYEARHYPYHNLGRIYERLGDWSKAVQEYKGALRVFPEYEAAKQSLIRLLAMTN
jgi:tetratricopeptide (TPR) repeat protein